jgi:hypothetical protein
MFSGHSEYISMEEIYGVDFNSSIYKFNTHAGPYGANTTTTIEVTLQHLNGLDVSYSTPSGLLGLLGLSFLSSSEELCATFFFLWDRSVKDYSLIISLYEVPKRMVSLKGFMSLPNQARSYDQFQLFKDYQLPNTTKTIMDFSVYSLKFLQKRNTAAEPCIDVDNYDKVHLLSPMALGPNDLGFSKPNSSQHKSSKYFFKNM